MLAYDYPTMGVFWSLTMLSLWVLWIYSVIWCFMNLFRDEKQTGLVKGIWFLVLLLFPVVGVFAYLVSRPFPHDDERL